MARLEIVGLAIIAAVCGCSALEPSCDPPDELTYSCAPVPLGTVDACQGGPSFDGASHDTDKAFPAGCEADFPFCVAAYPDEVQDCYCQDPGDGTFQWVCPV